MPILEDKFHDPIAHRHTASVASEGRASTTRNSIKKSSMLIVLNRNLMAPDSFKNLGFGEDSDGVTSSAATSKQSLQPAYQDRPQGSK